MLAFVQPNADKPIRVAFATEHTSKHVVTQLPNGANLHYFESETTVCGSVACMIFTELYTHRSEYIRDFRNQHGMDFAMIFCLGTDLSDWN